MIKTFFYKTINLIFFIGFSWIFLNVIFNNKQGFIQYNPLIIILLSILVLLVFFIVNKNLEKRCLNMDKRKKLTILIFAMTIILIIQVVFGYYLRVVPSWDFGSVYDNAVSLVTNGKVSSTKYFLNFRNNTGILLIISFAYKIGLLLGVNRFLAIGIVLNIIIIDLSIILMFAICDKVFGTAKAFLALFIAAISTPLYTYTPIFYTDTLSLVFPVLILYLVIIADDVKETWKKYCLYAFIGGIGFLGGQVKLTVTFMLIAISLQLFLQHNIKSYVPKISVIVVNFIITMKIFNSVVDYSGIFDFNMSEKSPTPFTHWVMMSLKEKGGWNWEDYEFTYSFPTREERIEENVKEIKNRLNDYKVEGYFMFLTRKATWTWGDGTYFAPEKLRRKPINVNFYHQLVLKDGRYFKYYAYFSQAIHIAVLFLILVSAFLNIKNSNNSHINILRIVMLGIITFLLIWETRSRYILNYIPIFILIAIEGIQLLEKLSWKEKTT